MCTVNVSVPYLEHAHLCLVQTVGAEAELLLQVSCLRLGPVSSLLCLLDPPRVRLALLLAAHTAQMLIQVLVSVDWSAHCSEWALHVQAGCHRAWPWLDAGADRGLGHGWAQYLLLCACRNSALRCIASSFCLCSIHKKAQLLGVTHSEHRALCTMTAWD